MSRSCEDMLLALVLSISASIVPGCGPADHHPPSESDEGGSQAASPAEAELPTAEPASPEPAEHHRAAPIWTGDRTETDSGMSYAVLRQGKGKDRAALDGAVSIHYTGWDAAGARFAGNEDQGRPSTFPLNRILPDLRDVLVEMALGEQRLVWIPEENAFAEREDAPEGTVLYEIELVEILRAPEVPEHLGEPPALARRSRSGLYWRALERGTAGPPSTPPVAYLAHFSIWNTDGKLIESSRLKGRPALLSPSKVVDGLAEGLRFMGVGDHYRFWAPENLTYLGRKGAPKGMLIFDVEVFETLMPEGTPEDLKQPPPDAERRASGLTSIVLEAGSGTRHPNESSTVTIHYTAWTEDGEVTASAIERGHPVSVPISGVIPGWAEGLQLMVVGERRRLWVPAELAFQGRDNRPPGAMVYEIEMLAISD